MAILYNNNPIEGGKKKESSTSPEKSWWGKSTEYITNLFSGEGEDDSAKWEQVHKDATGKWIKSPEVIEMQRKVGANDDGKWGKASIKKYKEWKAKNSKSNSKKETLTIDTISDYVKMSPAQRAAFLQASGYNIGRVSGKDSDYGPKAKKAELALYRSLAKESTKEQRIEDNIAKIKHNMEVAPDAYGIIPPHMRAFVRNIIDPNYVRTSKDYTAKEIEELSRIVEMTGGKVTPSSYSKFNTGGVNESGAIAKNTTDSLKKTLGSFIAKEENGDVYVKDRYNFNTNGYKDGSREKDIRLLMERTSPWDNIKGAIRDGIEGMDKHGYSVYNFIRHGVAPHYASVDYSYLKKKSDGRKEKAMEEGNVQNIKVPKRDKEGRVIFKEKGGILYKK